MKKDKCDIKRHVSVIKNGKQTIFILDLSFTVLSIKKNRNIKVISNIFSIVRGCLVTVILQHSATIVALTYFCD
jgi:hypothetical protein